MAWLACDQQLQASVCSIYLIYFKETRTITRFGDELMPCFHYSLHRSCEASSPQLLLPLELPIQKNRGSKSRQALIKKLIPYKFHAYLVLLSRVHTILRSDMPLGWRKIFETSKMLVAPETQRMDDSNMLKYTSRSSQSLSNLAMNSLCMS